MRNKTYFISDVHLGAQAFKNDREREIKLVNWLTSIQENAKAIYLMGDIFDFWYEYKYVVPKGFVRLLGKLAELTDKGIPVHFYIGNHDIWTYGYLQNEIGLIVHKNAEEVEIDGKLFYLAHGDRTGYRPLKVKLMHSIFHSEIVRRIYNFFVHPRINLAFGLAWSKNNRKDTHTQHEAQYLGEDKEDLVQFCKQTLQTKHYDYFVFGHRHVMLDLAITKNSRVVYLGDWINKFSYGVFDEDGFRLEILESEL